MKLRHTAAFGIVNSVWPLCFSVHDAIISGSIFPTSAARVSAMLASNRASRSAREVAAVFLWAATSNSDWLKVTAPQLGRFATWVASSTSDIDFACGFHVNLSSGTRSRSFRVTTIS